MFLSSVGALTGGCNGERITQLGWVQWGNYHNMTFDRSRHWHLRGIVLRPVSKKGADSTISQLRMI